MGKTKKSLKLYEYNDNFFDEVNNKNNELDLTEEDNCRTKYDPTLNERVKFKVINVKEFKQVFNLFKSSIPDCPLEFTNKGINIYYYCSQTKSYIVNAFIDESKLENYQIKEKFTTIVDIQNFNKELNGVNDTYFLTFFVSGDSYSPEYGFESQNNSGSRKKTHKFICGTTFKDNVKKIIDTSSYPVHVSMESTIFKNIFKNKKNVNFIMNIMCDEDSLTFKSKKVYNSNIEEFIPNNDKSIVFLKSPTEIIAGDYNLDDISNFSKCDKLCGNVEIFMQKNAPLIIKHTLSIFGTITTAFNPIMVEGKD